MKEETNIGYKMMTLQNDLSLPLLAFVDPPAFFQVRQVRFDPWTETPTEFSSSHPTPLGLSAQVWRCPGPELLR